MKSLLPQAFAVSNVHPRPRKHLSRCTLDCGFKTPESPALRGFVAERCPITGTSLYLVLLSNGFPYSKIRLKKFDFSPIDTPANIAKKLPSQRCSQPFLIAFSTSRTNGPRSLLQAKAGTHSAFRERSHTRAYTPKQGPSLHWPQCGYVLPAKSLLFHHAFIYIHFPVLCDPPLYQIRQSCRHQRCFKSLFIAFFNFSHKRPTFALTPESGYTPLALANRIAHRGSHGETGGHFGWGWYHYPRTVPHVHKHPRAGYQNGVLCRFWVLAGCALEERRKPSGQRCAYARRCPEASRPRRAA